MLLVFSTRAFGRNTHSILVRDIFAFLGRPHAFRHSPQKHFQEKVAEPQVSPLRSSGFPVKGRGVDVFRGGQLDNGLPVLTKTFSVKGNMNLPE